MILKDKLKAIQQVKFQDPEEFIADVEVKAAELKKADGKWDETDTLEHICCAVANPHRAAVRPWRRELETSPTH